MRPFSSRRLRTRSISKRPNLVSRTPMARFSKSMNTAILGSSDMLPLNSARENFSRDGRAEGRVHLMRPVLKLIAPPARIVPAALGVLLLGCSALGPAIEQPEVFLLRITPLESTVFEQRVETEFRLRNPNDIDLAIDGLDLTVKVNGTR